MPRYNHKCDRCGLSIDIICPMRERDEPKPCSAHFTDSMRKQERKELDELRKTVSASAVVGVVNSCLDCDGQGQLRRPEDELEVTSFTPYAWRP